MAQERNSGTKAVLTLVVVVLLSALLAYFLHFRPVDQASPTPHVEYPHDDTGGPSPR